MTETPKDRSSDGARVIDFETYKRKGIRQEPEPMTAPGPMHPAARAMAKKTEAEKDKEFSEKFDLDL